MTNEVGETLDRELVVVTDPIDCCKRSCSIYLEEICQSVSGEQTDGRILEYTLVHQT